ncbi:AraC family transcriptional regulator [Pararhodobacter sp. CCB-MM2]|uniref:helix-turn-helix domain-containing protein n=1 Tax=Pararhodobacter sp. CCB-MM2 TaxID=1786003 RepID=UPI00082A9364|nr:AraC family transcriptional regulator [Pararhodobacter sp. CCB-MM2]
MLLVPVTLFASAALAIILGYLLANRDLRVTANRIFIALVTLYLLQSLLVSLRWGYEWTALRLPMGLVAALIPSCTWLAFRALTGLSRQVIGMALIPALGGWAALVVAPDLADLFIPLVYLGFGLLILLQVLRENEPPALTPLGNARQTRLAMGVIGGTLVTSAMTDGFILYDFIRTGGQSVGQAVSIVQTGFILLVGVAALFGRSSPEADAPTIEDPAPMPDAQPDDAEMQALLTRLEALFTEGGLHRDEDLSLRKLARRLGVPDRRVSESVNRLRGQNLSQFVNDFRIKDACQLLRYSDQSVLQIALTVGFASKSNFNREFARVTGQSPTAWRKASATA